ncbi:pseudouridine synthase [Microbacterium sp. ZXX196]|uniref:pseudouridine synthase n=1 Tax=Microbacterium sp. ZXX196 TaxID=2609291 RepID=UPI0034D39145
MPRFGKRILAPRDGITAARLRAPGGSATHAQRDDPVPASVGEWLAEVVLPRTLGREQAFGAIPIGPAYFTGPGELTDQEGRRVALEDPLIPGGFYVFHKPVLPERRVPFEVRIVHEDADLLVVDKPHFLASTPNGLFVRECVVTRLRVERGEDDLVAIHRLDRVTAGLLALSRRPSTRGAYQRMFQERGMRKTYRALALLPDGWREGDPLPLGAERGEEVVYRSRLVKRDGQRQVEEVPGPDNAVTGIRLLRTFAHAGRRVAEFRLAPYTGKTHQLRVHMNALGLPLMGDPVYPVDTDPDPYDFSHELQLLAAELAFRDPFTGAERRFASGLALDAARA